MPGHDQDRFAGAVAIVTGAASGIGKALSTALVARGASVLLADIDREGAASVAASLGVGLRARAVEVDVTDRARVREVVEATASDHGRLDYLFNNAGIGAGGPVEELPGSLWERAIDVDLNSVIYGVAAAYPLMVRAGTGHIVNTASLAGLVPSPFLTPYAAAKSAVVGLSTSLRVEAAARGVRVSVVCPGPVETPLLNRPDPDEGPRTRVDGRKLLTNALGEPYPPGDLAADVLAGVAENRAIIVAPATARAAWEAFRADPEGVLAALEARAVTGRERRAARGAGG
jgi:NAD(P)-dependent dehydrogenase (short-subunit alcohol dehydrogenase family)